MTRVYLGMGSNLGDRLQWLRRAVEGLRGLPEVAFVDASPIYCTEPWEQRPGEIAQREQWFFNCLVAIDTALEPDALLARLQALEGRLGRRRGPGSLEDRRYEPRTLDIDILLYGERVVSGPEDLHIPHLLMHERAFVLRPLADLAPDLEHPTCYRTIGDLLADLQDEHQVLPADEPRRWFDP